MRTWLWRRDLGKLPRDKKEVVGPIFGCMSGFVDADGHPLTGTQWVDVIEGTKKSYWLYLEKPKMLKKKKAGARKGAASAPTAAAGDGEHASAPTAADDDADVDLDIIPDSDIGPCPATWESPAFNVFVVYGPPSGDDCVSYLQYKARSREGGDEVVVAKAGNNAKILKPNGTGTHNVHSIGGATSAARGRLHMKVSH